ncbi:SDR family NAD(P)-dependent oxidoreductase [Paenibacillus sp. FSL L8-0470]|uniref:type I polyketide synthase n=1 Tax=unclassified Paenibacillus TaxID=185978 RepID=UPI0030FCBF17
MKKKLVDFDTSEVLLTNENIKFEQISSKDIAVIGVSCQIGSAKNTNEFWDSMVEGKCLVEEIPQARQKDITDALKQSGITHQEFKKASYLGSIDTFDYKFFSLPAIEAQLMDPHQRLFLETVYATMEDAGYGGRELAGSETGVFVGLSSDGPNEYKAFAQMSAPELVGLTTSGNLKSIIAGRVSYIFDFKGPSSVVDTACSSSLSALHLACRSIRAGECNTAIAGSVKIVMLPASQSNDYSMGIESSVGYTRTFDAESDGTNGAEGVAAVLLKPLHQAMADHDHIYAVVKGSAWNQDGSSVGLTAPNPAAQERVILRAWQDAGIDPESISYLEAHGTGTKLGDPIEIRGINNAFRKHTSKMQFCAVGSVKTNIGHLDHAAGIAGFIKAVLALEHQKIPPMLHFKVPNPNISFIDSPVYVADQLIRWERSPGAKRRCGVSSFGLSGTNCHVVLEEAPERTETSPDHLHHIFTLSAMEQTNLLDMVRRYIDFLSGSVSKYRIGDICYTVNTGRGHYAHRLVLRACSIEELLQQLERFLKTPFVTMEEHHIYYGSHNVSTNKATWPDSETATGSAAEQVKELLTNISRDLSDAGRTFHDFAQAYIQGAEMNWKLLYPARSYYKVSLPTYSYTKSRCWISIPEKHIELVERREALPSLQEAGHYYQPEWVRRDMDDKRTEPIDGKTVFFRTTAPLSSQIRTCLERQDRDYIEVYYGSRYSKVTDREYVISGNDADYLLLLEQVGKVGHIIHAFEPEERLPHHTLELQERLARSVYSLVSLSKALFKKQRRQEAVITVLTRWANAVTGEEQQIHPVGAAVLGMAKVIHQEHPYLYTRSFDLDETIEPPVLEVILSPIREAAECAFRNGVRYIESIQAAELRTTEAVGVRGNGVYVITGGHGGIGLEVAKHWAGQQQISMVLINRTPLPSREEWSSIKAGNNPERKRIVESIEEMESLGSSIHSYSADVSDFAQMDMLFRQIRASLGNINGIFHAAGIAGDGMLFRRTHEQMDAVLSPKITGTWNLHLLTKDDDLDFFVLCSSLASLTGGTGQGDYTAANRFMDSFAAYRAGLGLTACSINWPAWKEVGMAANYGVKESDNLVSHISPRAALAALDQILDSNRSRVILGEMNSAHASQVPVNGQLQEQQPFKTVQLAGRESGEYTELEKLLASIWGELFERDVMRVDDNFYDLGGHSLLLIRVEVELEKHGVAVDQLNIERDRTLEKIAETLEYSNSKVED